MPPSPSMKAFPQLENPEGSNVRGNLSRRNTKSKPLASAKKAEEVSEELATKIAKFIDLYRGPPKDIQATIKNQLLLTFNPGLSRKRCAQMASLNDDASSKKRRLIVCDQCPTTTARQCDMRKHKKRHTRPYGCTFPGCSKKLGSKNDWKRHENTQHYQIETWRCHELSQTNSMGQCASIFYRREQFQSHLREKHGIEKDDDIRDKCRRHHIGRNGQTAFWCGFCKQIVELKTAGLDAWEERFSHIDDLHYKKGQTIYDWVPLDSDIPKGLMERGSVAESEQADDDNDVGGNEGSSDDDGESSSTSKRPSPQPAGKRSAKSTGVSAERDTSSKRQAAASKRGRIWNCKFQAAPRVVVFFHIRPLSVPTVPFEERFTVTRPLNPSATGPGHQFFRITLRHGYMDEVVSVDLGFQIYEQLRSFIIQEGARAQYQPPKRIKWAVPDGPAENGETELATPEDHLDEITQMGDDAQPGVGGMAPITAQPERTQQGLMSLQSAYEDQVVYVVGKEQMRILDVTGCKPRGWCRRIALAALLWLRSNTGSKDCQSER
ncbi:MAG: hypothetical protein Q9208_008212 [Pyrenodesmia sp. 3 TL-2023]